MSEFRKEAEQPKPKIGQGHASAMFRSGAKELSAILPAFPDSVQPVEEYGLFATKLPSEIADDRKGMDLEPEQKSNPNHNIELEM